MSEIGKRVRLARNTAGLSQQQLAEDAGVSQVTIQNLESGRNKSTRALLAIARRLNVNPDWLETGNGPRAATDGFMVREDPEHPYTSGAVRVTHVPVVGDAQAGDSGYWEAPEFPVGHGDGAVLYPSTDRNAYALKVHGDSMSPRFRHGEFVIIWPNHEPTPGDEVLVRTAQGRCMIKVFLYWRDDRLYLDSINNGAGHGPISISKEDVIRFQYVAGSVKKALHIEE